MLLVNIKVFDFDYERFVRLRGLVGGRSKLRVSYRLLSSRSSQEYSIKDISKHVESCFVEDYCDGDDQSDPKR
jgi:hypothetical protein